MNRRINSAAKGKTWQGPIGTAALAVILCLALGVGCKPRPKVNAPAKGPVLEVVFTYGSEKKAWIQDVTGAFNAAGHKSTSGKTIEVKAIAMGSGESKDDLLAGNTKAHVWSPASGVFVKMANAASQVKGGPLVGATQDLVLSPVVIAMWKPQAEALGWPNKPIGWAEVLALARHPSGWSSVGHPEWGKFKFGHTHPEYSNSGLISVLAEIYASAGKANGLTVEDVRTPKVASDLSAIESAVVHYGKSTGFFGDTMFDNGPRYLSAAVLYESTVIESYARQTEQPVVAIYPKEGTVWSDHPIGIVQREWVSEEHKAAAQLYIDFLRAPAQQAKALAYGFRPGDASVALGSPIDSAHGVDPKQPQTVLEAPAAAVVDAAIELWRSNKKHAHVALVFDQSGSMKDEDKIGNARAGAVELINMLGDEDDLVLVPFSKDVQVIAGGPLKRSRAQMLQRVNGLQPLADTRLYDAIAEAYKHLAANPQAGKISAIVVLTDGEDTGKTRTLQQLLGELQGDVEAQSIRVFTIAYGKGAKTDILKRIAKETKAESYQAKPETIRTVFRDIATFF